MPCQTPLCKITSNKNSLENSWIIVNVTGPVLKPLHIIYKPGRGVLFILNSSWTSEKKQELVQDYLLLTSRQPVTVVINGPAYESFCPSTGSLHTCVLSPLFFTFYTDDRRSKYKLAPWRTNKVFQIELNSWKYRLHFSRYTSKGATVYAIMTTKPPKPTVQLLGPKTSAATKVKRLRPCCFYRL